MSSYLSLCAFVTCCLQVLALRSRLPEEILAALEASKAASSEPTSTPASSLADARWIVQEVLKAPWAGSTSTADAGAPIVDTDSTATTALQTVGLWD